MTGEKPTLRQIVVVEGRYDKAAVLSVVDATVVETGGFHIFHDPQTVDYLRKLAQTRGVILLTDSDGAGAVIRGKLKGMLGDTEVLQAYVPDIFGKERRKRAPSKEGKLGVEGMPGNVILEALRRCGGDFGSGGRTAGGISKADLYALGLTGGGESKAKRLALQRALGLPERLGTNGLLDALNAFLALPELERILGSGTQDVDLTEKEKSKY